MDNRTDEKRAAFLDALREGDSVTAAAKAGGIARSTAYKWRDEDSDFAADWDDAVETGTDVLEDVAVQRAKDGSDTMLIFMLKGRRGWKFKERVAQEHSGSVQHSHTVDLTNLSDEQLASLGSIARALEGGAGES